VSRSMLGISPRGCHFTAPVGRVEQSPCQSPSQKNDLTNACTSRPINLVSATAQIHRLVSLARWRCRCLVVVLPRNGVPFLASFLCLEIENKRNPAFNKKSWLILPNSTVSRWMILAAMLCSLLHSWRCHRQGFCASTALALRWFQ
jgi:hypothetical protein